MKVSDSPPSRKVPYVNLAAQVEEERETLMPLVMAALARADHVLGAAVGELETALAAWHGTKYAVALNSGTDALMLSMICLLYTSPSPRDGLLSRMPSSA